MEVSLRFRDILDHLESGRDVHFADHLIAAIAMAHDVPLLTLNRKHFAAIKGLKLA
jgi:predicted nucleic acid-binding protein